MIILAFVYIILSFNSFAISDTWSQKKITIYCPIRSKVLVVTKKLKHGIFFIWRTSFNFLVDIESICFEGLMSGKEEKKQELQ